MTEKVKEVKQLLREGLYRGIGWSFGVTVGFALVSSLLYLTLKFAGGVPLIGVWIASLVKATQSALYR